MSLAACAGFATTPAYAGEPHALMRHVEVGNVLYVDERAGRTSRSAREASVHHVQVGLVGKHAEALSQVDRQPPEDAHTKYLIKLLASSSQFRVRAQAAISLGMMESSLAARSALTAALQDPHPAVRAAAATSLGRIGEGDHVIALRMLATDPEEPVRNAARTSIGRIESLIEASQVALETTAATRVQRL